MEPPEPEKIQDLLDTFWLRITRIAGELNEATGLGVLVATKYPDTDSEADPLSGERRRELYLNFPARSRGGGQHGVKVKPQDCQRCCLDYHSSLSAKEELLQEQDPFQLDGNFALPGVPAHLKVDRPETPDIKVEYSDTRHQANPIPAGGVGEEAELGDDGQPLVSVITKNNSTTPEENGTVSTKMEDHDFAKDTESAEENIKDETVKEEPGVRGRLRKRLKMKKKTQGKRIFKTAECDICGKVLTRANTLARHMLTHTKTSSFVCVCGKICLTEKSLRSHERIAHGEKRFKCEECGKGFPVENQLNNHLWTHRDEKRFKCDICEKEFKTRRNFKCHMRIHQEPTNPFKCDECNTEFSTDVALKRHQIRHTDQAPSFLCPECGKKFSHPQNLRRHILIHKGIKPYKCGECGKSFSQLTVLEAHKRVHTGVTPYMCSDCGKTFSNAPSLKRHISLHDGIKPHKCDECGKAFNQLHSLTTHQKQHTGVNLFKCTVCGMEFRYEKAFNSHMESHSDYSLETKCYICGEEFDFNFRLRIHMRNHIEKGGPEYATKSSSDPHMDLSSDRKMDCYDPPLNMHSANNMPPHSIPTNVMPAHSMPTNSMLTSSMLSNSMFANSMSASNMSTSSMSPHTMPKPEVSDKDYLDSINYSVPNTQNSSDKTIKCEECGKEFNGYGNYKRHTLIHTGEKPFKCDICGKDFRQRVALNVHIRTHTGDKPYKCNFCEREFSESRALKKHMNFHVDKDLQKH